jgi:hypothetical protein
VLLLLLYIRQRDVRILPLYVATVALRRWLRPLKFTLEGTVASEVVTPGPFTKSHKQRSHGVRAGNLGGQVMGTARPIHAV